MFSRATPYPVLHCRSTLGDLACAKWHVLTNQERPYEGCTSDMDSPALMRHRLCQTEICGAVTEREEWL